jgi:transcriptional regulator with XRE-family HTH domain
MEKQPVAPNQLIARTVRHRRKQLGLTQGEVAARAGISRQAVADVEAGHRDSRDKTLTVVEQALGLNAGALSALRAGAPPDLGLATIRAELLAMINEITSVDVMKQVRVDIVQRRMAALQAQLADYEVAVNDEQDNPTERAG